MTHTVGYIEHCIAQPTPQLPLRTQPTSPKGYVGQAISSQEPLLLIRKNRQNPNHHLWNNNGTWFICYTTTRDPALSGTRHRRSLKTKSVVEARRLRDRLLASLSPTTLFTHFN
jgi:hypothetical protein